jgi:hypothetical protein
MKNIIKATVAGAFILASGLVLADPVSLNVADLDQVSAGFQMPTLSVAGGTGTATGIGFGAHANTYSVSTTTQNSATNNTAASANGFFAGASSTSMAVLVK